MTWYQNMMYKFLCCLKGHIQVRDWELPTFLIVGPCDRCGQTTYRHWSSPTLLNILFLGK